MRVSLPSFNLRSGNPRNKKHFRKIPTLNLLGISNSKKDFDQNRPLPSFLPPLDKFAQLHDFDKLQITPLPGAPLRPTEVLQVFQNELNGLEIGEILNYRYVWYIGKIDVKPTNPVYDSDYDDRKHQYRANINDQIQYRYQILGVAGGGAFSKVYRCFDHKERKPVAIKIIRAKQDCLQYANIEAEIQSAISSPHSVKLYEIFPWRGHMCFSMELLDTDIYSILEQSEFGTYPISTVRHITYQVLQVLYELHRKMIIHADVKPENILSLDKKATNVKLGDYGTACYENKQIFSYIQSRYYRAPEVLFGKEYTCSIDMWSLGCVIYELLEGNPLFPAQDEDELFDMMVGAIGPPPDGMTKRKPDNPVGQSLEFLLEDFNADAAELISACLEWDPDDRITPEEGLNMKWMTDEYHFLKKKADLTKNNQKISEPITPRRIRWRY